MKFTADYADRADEIVALFTNTFTYSEGAEEGALIGKLAREMISTTPRTDLFVFSCHDEGDLAGCIMFSRLSYAEDDRTVFVLAPVAVEPARQGRGIGQNLLRFGLDELRHKGIDVALTYGDPAYYGKVGFAPITEAMARAPFQLQMPQRWLGQSLTDRPLAPLKGPSRCVEALNAPEYW